MNPDGTTVHTVLDRFADPTTGQTGRSSHVRVMAKPQHRTKAYRAERKRLTPIVARGQAICAQPICIMPTRWIPPGTPWDLAHDDAGLVILGPAHARCNRSEAGKKRHRVAPTTPRRWLL